MEELRVVGVEDGALHVSSDSGEQFRIPVDESLASRVRQALPDPGTGRKLSPKDIQAHIRSGMSAQDVASITGASLDYVQRFEGPILAERAYVIDSAMAVPVHTALGSELGDQHEPFGAAILTRLLALKATGERWASWKEQAGGWVIKLTFTVDQIDHDARWQFDPRKASLAPLNKEAETLSQQGDPTAQLIPRLRAVDDASRTVDTTRFDSGAFSEQELSKARDAAPPAANLNDTAPHLEAIPYGRVGSGQAQREPASPPPTNQTADLLEALRRRRGERESAHYDEVEDAMANHPATGSIRLVEVPMPEPDNDDEAKRESSSQSPFAPKPTKKGRAAMPSWDDIVFGARSDDDPA